ncbi:MAG: zf-HC2 domain-containing protein [Planctomycetes bacterium]|nr:zf-HC2 domain-containing protein [Planctomycetota bacterium]
MITCTDAMRMQSEAFDDRLDQAARMRFDTHLATCSECAGRYADYELLFAAVQALPAIENEAPCPYPETARAFVRPEAPPSMLRRLAAAAAMILVLGGIGFTAFEAGRRRAPARGTELAEAVVNPVDVVLPDYEAQQQARQVVNRARQLGFFAETGPRYADVGTLRMVDLSRDNLQNSSKALAGIPSERLGTFHSQFSEIAGQLDDICAEVDHGLRSRDATIDKLRFASQVVVRRDLAGKILLLGNLSRSAQDVEVDAPIDGDAMQLLTAGLARLERRDAPGALRIFRAVGQVPAVRGSPLSELVHDLEVCVLGRVSGTGQPLPVTAPPTTLKAVRSYYLDQPGVWIEINDQRGGSLRIGEIELRVRPLRLPTQDETERLRPIPAPRPGKGI